jgi:4-hydroxy-tetrahydrodipicolinate reductase
MKVAIAGAGGRMGQALVEAVLAEHKLAEGGLELVAALDAAGSPAIGRAAGPVQVQADLGGLSAADVLIDFTRPAGTLLHLEACLKFGKAMVIGTTGFSEAQQQRIAAAAKRIPIVQSPNFAIGVNVVFRLAQVAAQALGEDYDVEIVEAHHRHKVDAPSGTALKLGELVAGALGRKLREVAAHGRSGDTGERPAGEIGFHAIRGGDIIGEHTVIFAGAGERVEVVVRSQSRLTYAAGALRAARWLEGRGPGLYDMSEVLGLR